MNSGYKYHKVVDRIFYCFLIIDILLGLSQIINIVISTVVAFLIAGLYFVVSALTYYKHGNKTDFVKYIATSSIFFIAILTTLSYK